MLLKLQTFAFKFHAKFLFKKPPNGSFSSLHNPQPHHYRHLPVNCRIIASDNRSMIAKIKFNQKSPCTPQSAVIFDYLPIFHDFISLPLFNTNLMIPNNKIQKQKIKNLSKKSIK